MQLSQIRNEVRGLLAEPQAGGFFSDTELNSFINEAQIRLQTDTLFLESTATTNLVKNAALYSLEDQSISDLMYIIEVKIKKDNKWKGLEFIPREELRNIAPDWENASSGTPEFYSFYRRNVLLLYPPPDFDMTNGLKIYYKKMPATLNLDTDVSEFSDKFKFPIVYYACYLAKLKEGSGEESGFLNLYIESVRSILLTYNRLFNEEPNIFYKDRNLSIIDGRKR